MPSRRAITEEEYWRAFDLINEDVEAAIKANHTHFTINNLVLKDVDVYHKVNRAADFFQTNAYALQTTFFIAFGRIFDARRDAHSILKLIETTIANPQFFSKEAFRVRKRKIANIHGTDPEWLEPRVAEAWEPTSTELAELPTALEPHHQKFKSIYQPIRHSFFAHRSMESDVEIFARFQKTNIKEAEEILRFLCTLLWSIRDLGWNGNQINLADYSSYDGWVGSMNRKTTEFIQKLP